jgi:hypothetical protein
VFLPEPVATALRERLEPEPDPEPEAEEPVTREEMEHLLERLEANVSKRWRPRLRRSKRSAYPTNRSRHRLQSA